MPKIHPAMVPDMPHAENKLIAKNSFGYRPLCVIVNVNSQWKLWIGANRMLVQDQPRILLLLVQNFQVDQLEATESVTTNHTVLEQQEDGARLVLDQQEEGARLVLDQEEEARGWSWTSKSRA